MQQPTIARLESSVRFDRGRPGEGGFCLAPFRSARFTGFIHVPVSGDYAFRLDYESMGGKLTIDHQVLFDFVREGFSPALIGTVHLDADHPIPIELNLFLWQPPYVGETPPCSLVWGPPGQILSPVPSAAFSPPADYRKQVEAILSQAPFTYGIRADYAANAAWKDPLVSHLEPVVHYWHTGLPLGVPGYPYSVRWTGRLHPAFSEKYKFRFTPDFAPPQRLLINGRVICSTLDPTHKLEGFVQLDRRETYEFTIEATVPWGAANVIPLWSSPSQPETTIGPFDLSLPAECPKIVIVSPAAGDVVESRPSSQVRLEVVADPKIPLEDSIKQVEFFDERGKRLGVSAASPFVVTTSELQAGTHLLVARATDKHGNISVTWPLQFDVVAKAGALPEPWMEINPISQPPQNIAEVHDQEWTLAKPCGAFFDNSDAVRFPAVSLGSCSALTTDILKVDAVDPQHASSGGVVVRASIRSGSPQLCAMFGPAGAKLYARANYYDTQETTELSLHLPCRIKVERIGSMVTVSASENIEPANQEPAWTRIGQLVVDAVSPIWVGPMLAGDDGATLTIRPPKLVNECSPEGIRLRDGSLIAGKLTDADATGVKLNSPLLGPRQFSLDQVADIYPNPGPVRQHAAPKPRDAESADRQVELDLINGDFSEGTFSAMKDGQITIDSILFGQQAIKSKDVLAIHFATFAALSPVSITLLDGSIMLGRNLKIADVSLTLDEDLLGNVSIPVSMVRDMQRTPFSKSD